MHRTLRVILFNFADDYNFNPVEISSDFSRADISGAVENESEEVDLNISDPPPFIILAQP